MCGIAGSIGSKDLSVINHMLKKINHRGDSEPRAEVINNSILGCAQLRIIDRDNGQQPIYNEDKNIAVVFNGEIYNYLNLKKDLEFRGHIFKTVCDTEVLVHLYEEYREDMLLYLDGMFAFMIYDTKSETFFGARDYFGVKPFFYCWDKNTLYFSSEMKSFEKIPTKEIYELGPSQYIKNGDVKKYYDFASNIVNESNFFEAKEKVRKLITNSVSKRVQTDLPIGVFFSGGIDSTITLHLCKEFHDNVTALILGDENSEDVKYAKRYCDNFNIQYYHQMIDIQQLLTTIADTIYTIESFEPNPVRGSVLSAVLGEQAKSLGLKVVLCGEGGDEIFAGYGDFLSIENDNEFQNLSFGLLRDLYRTQLLRVDRTAMANGVEVREPFLDKSLVEFALSLPSKFKVNVLSNGNITTKLILREAFIDVLPKEIYERPKMTLMEGAGVRTVNPGEGVFFEYANSKLSDLEFDEIRKSHSDFRLLDKEEAYYFKIFYNHFPNARFATKRTISAQSEI